MDTHPAHAVGMRPILSFLGSVMSHTSLEADLDDHEDVV